MIKKGLSTLNEARELGLILNLGKDDSKALKAIDEMTEIVKNLDVKNGELYLKENKE